MNNLFQLVITLLFLSLVTPFNAFCGTYLDTLNIGKELAVIFDEEEKVEKKTEVKYTEPSSDSKQLKSESTQAVQRSVVPNGFRIQILASSSVDAVREKKNELEEVILLPMYISFKSPYYKLLAGNFTDRESAEKALAGVKEQGLTDAWIISSEVFKKE